MTGDFTLGGAGVRPRFVIGTDLTLWRDRDDTGFVMSGLCRFDLHDADFLDGVIGPVSDRPTLQDFHLIGASG